MAPVRKYSVEEAADKFTAEAIAEVIEIAKLSGYYKGTFTVDVIDKLGVQLKARSFMDEYFPGWNN